MKAYILILIYWGCALSPTLAQNSGSKSGSQPTSKPIGFVEQWVLSSDRAATLKQLVPETDDYYFFHALHYQQTKQRQKFTTSMTEWRQAIEESDNLDRQRYEVMHQRGIILDYDQDPKGSIEKLINLLGVNLDHQRPITPEEANIPSVLDPASVSEQAFRKQAAKNGPEYESLFGHQIPLELKKAKTFDRKKRLWFLKETERVDYPGVTELILAELKEKSQPDFGSIPKANNLLLNQLIWLEKQHPALREHKSFVETRLSRMKPGGKVWQLHHPKKTLAWLEQCWSYCSALPPKHNSLKAHVLYQLLDHHRHQGRYPEKLFLEYIKLPRVSSNPLRVQKPFDARNRCDMGANYHHITGAGAIHNDNDLVIDYLYHALAQKNDSSPYSKYFYHDELTRIHAQARLMAGADAKFWGKKLTPEEFKTFRNNTEVLLSLDNQKQWSSTDQVVLQLNLKNTPKLTVRVFEIDALSHIRHTGNDPSANIKLNGLVPHHEQEIAFPQPPLVRHRHQLKLPELKGRGIWIIECIANGVSCRSLVRKGSLQLIAHDTNSGQTAMVFDEQQHPIHPATIWLKGTSYKSTKNGEIRLPFASSARVDQAIVHAPQFDMATGDTESTGLAVATKIRRVAKIHHLKVVAGTDLEQLVAGKSATLFIRAKLTCNGKAAPVSTIKKTKLHIHATLRGGISTELTDLSIKIPADGIITQTIHIPEEAREISVTLSGEIPTTNKKEPREVEDSASLKINGVNDSLGIAQPMLAYTKGGWKIDLLGHNGEPLARRTLNLEFYRLGFISSVTQTLRTDAKGQIHLGDMSTFASLDIEATDYSSALSTTFMTDNFAWPDEIHITEGENIRIPAPDPEWIVAQDHYCGLLRHNGNHLKPVASMDEKLSIKDGHIVIKQLTDGNYTLFLGNDDHPIHIRVIQGKRNHQWISDSTRSIEHHNPQPFHITTARAGAETVSAQVKGNTESTRVIVIGTRYHRDYEHFRTFWTPNPNKLTRWSHSYLGNETMNGNTLSDEYRYILERRNAKTYPGNMLPRPGLILNRWKVEDSSSYAGGGTGGLDSIPATMEKRSKRKDDSGHDPSAPPTDSSPSFDFLARSSVIKMDVPVSKDGKISFKLEDFKHHQSVTIIAIDGENLATTKVALAANPCPSRERRLDRNLDPKKHYTGTQATAILRKGATAEIKNVLDADWRAYTELGHVYDYFHANHANPQLRDFVNLMEWPQLNEKQRLGAGQLLASHEFHLFAYFKDREWFNKHIKPALTNKRHRTFIDHFLLGNDLKPFLSPWKYQKLNAAEKALLARALPEHREAIVQDLTHRYEITQPGPDYETQLFASALKQNSLALRDRLGFASRDLARLENAERRYAGVQYIQQKLNNIIIPHVEFENVTISEAVEFLRLRTRELSHDNEGLNFVIKGNHNGSHRIDEMKVKNIPVGTLLQYICDKTRLRYRLTSYAVEILPLTSLEANDLHTRSISVSPDFMARLSESYDEGSDDDPFGGDSDRDENKGLLPRLSAKELLMNNGISFPENASVTYIPATSTLVVRNSQSNLDMIESITQVLRGSPKEGRKRLTSLPKDSEPGDALLTESDDDGADPFGGGDDAFAPPATGGFSPEEAEGLLTYIWSESNYYQHRNTDGTPSVSPNKFWIEFAKHDGKNPFLSARFNQCNDSTASMLIALAVLDLPFQGEKPEATINNLTLKVKAKSPMLLFYRDMRETDRVAKSTPLLVRQNFFRHGDRTRVDDQGRKVENTVSGAFLTGVPYTASFIITNPTGTPRELQVLTQIPRGAIALGGHPSSDAREIRIEKHATKRIEYSFYFPAAGTFPHYPAHVLEGGVVQAAAALQPIKVLDQPEKRDTRSWVALAREGSDEDVLNRLRTVNLQRTSLDPILWRLAKPVFYQKIITILKQRLFFDQNVYAYGMKHGDASTVRTYLENHDMVDSLGSHLDATLLSINGLERNHWEHLEFAPLINARQHKFQGHRQILNHRARDQYLTVLDSMAWKKKITQDDLLTLTYHLFLQDRVAEALEYFSLLKREQVVAKMQYDYLRCYALFYQEKPVEAADIAAHWIKAETAISSYWRGLFKTVADQAGEITQHQAKPNKPDNKPMQQVTHTHPSLDIESVQGKLAIQYHRLRKTSLRLYAVDLEVLFSENPFLDNHGNLKPSIRPNKSITLNLPQGKKQHLVTLPEELSRGNVLAMVESGDLRRVIALDSNSIRINRRISDRSLTITKSSDGRVLPRSYVKIYIENTDGEIEFFKDGYTDLRGMFPYESHTRITPDQIKRYAIFVSHPELGSKILTTR